jgi:CheY-like chemotaxis protein
MATILVIDDDDAVRRMVRLSLERAGHQVAEARNGMEGAMLYRSRSFDLVITDVFMPEQDGIETIQELRGEYPSIRILAISGGGSAGLSGPLTDARLLGADDVLAKPFDAAHLVTAVEVLLS